MKEERKVKILLVDKDPRILKEVKKVFLQYLPDLDIDISVTTGGSISFKCIPDVIVRNIENGNGSGLRMNFTSCTSFFQQSVSFLDTVIKIVTPTTGEEI